MHSDKHIPLPDVEAELYKIDSDELWDRIAKFECGSSWRVISSPRVLFVEERVPQNQESLKSWGK